MRQYFIRRLLLIVPTILGVTLLISSLLQLQPGNIADVIFAESATFNQELTKEQIEDDLGLDQNFLVQWVEWLGQVAQGDFGNYFRSGRPVSDELQQRIPVTLELSVISLVLSLFIALPIGILSAIRQDTPLDYVSRSSAIFMLAVPSFLLGTMFFVFAGRWAGWMVPHPIYQDLWEDPNRNFDKMWAPAVILAFGLAGSVMRLTRSQMLEVLRQDYVRTAWSKGLHERSVITRHAIKNAFIPVVSLIGVQITILVSGTVVLENIFALPGLGQMLFDALQQKEYVAVQGVLLVVALFVVVTNFLIDLTYSLLDPRIRYS